MKQLADDEDAPSVYLPTPRQIAESCQRIQATWPEAERRRRAGWAYSRPLAIVEPLDSCGLFSEGSPGGDD